MTETWALVPARAGSKGVPGKNVCDLCGHPILAYSVRAGLCAEAVSRVVVSTDSEDYAALARDHGAEVPFLRPSEFAGDQVGDLEVLRHALEWYRDNEGQVPELLVYLRPTTPLRDTALIDSAVGVLLADAGATALRSVHEMSESAYKTFEREGRFLRPVAGTDMDQANRARQAFPATYVGNGYVDVVRPARILAGESMLGNHVIAFETPPAAEIDSPQDLDYLRFQAGRSPDLVEALFAE